MTSATTQEIKIESASDAEIKVTVKTPILKLRSTHAEKVPHFYKSATIEKYIDEYKDLPAQRTAEWKKNREQKIGGSELHTFIKSRSIDAFVKQKKENVFNGNVHTAYGTLFEEEARKTLEYIFEAVVYELPGSIPHHKSEYSSFCYSGDGIAEVSTATLLHLIDEGIICEPQSAGTLVHYIKSLDKERIIVLFEIKCPSRRVPDGDIPDAYVPQVNMGGEVITICDLVIFCDFLFRKCAFASLFNGFEYDTEFHDKDGKLKFTFESPVAIGIHTMRHAHEQLSPQEIVHGKYTSTSESAAELLDESLQEKIAVIDDALGTMDLGAAGYSKFNYAMCGAFCKTPPAYKFFELGIIYTLFESQIADQINRAKKMCELVIGEYQADCSGLLPWKLLDFKMAGIAPTKKYLEAFSHKIKEFEKIIGKS